MADHLDISVIKQPGTLSNNDNDYKDWSLGRKSITKCDAKHQNINLTKINRRKISK